MNIWNAWVCWRSHARPPVAAVMYSSSRVSPTVISSRTHVSSLSGLGLTGLGLVLCDLEVTASYGFLCSNCGDCFGNVASTDKCWLISKVLLCCYFSLTAQIVNAQFYERSVFFQTHRTRTRTQSHWIRTQSSLTRAYCAWLETWWTKYQNPFTGTFFENVSIT